jgi:transcriptional regulator with XRE-family HTH domain
LIEARSAAGLSQSQLGQRMKTSQPHIARIEGGKVRPSTDALERFARARRTRLRIVFVRGGTVVADVWFDSCFALAASTRRKMLDGVESVKW